MTNIFRVVVLTDSQTARRAASFLEILGTYNPKAGEIKFESEKIKHLGY